MILRMARGQLVCLRLVSRHHSTTAPHQKVTPRQVGGIVNELLRRKGSKTYLRAIA